MTNIFKKVEIVSDFDFVNTNGIGSDCKRIMPENFILNLIAIQADKPIEFSQCAEQSGTIIYTAGDEIRAKIKMVVQLETRIQGEEIKTKILLSGDVALTDALNDNIRDIVLKHVAEDGRRKG